MIFKILNGESTIPVRTYIKQKTRITRSFHNKKFINVGISSNVYKFSFFTRKVKEWSTLPNSP